MYFGTRVPVIAVNVQSSRWQCRPDADVAVAIDGELCSVVAAAEMKSFCGSRLRPDPSLLRAVVGLKDDIAGIVGTIGILERTGAGLEDEIMAAGDAERALDVGVAAIAFDFKERLP